MKITLIYAAMNSLDYGLGKIIDFIRQIFSELNEEVIDVNLSDLDLPYFDGIRAEAAVRIIKNIKESQGVIFATTTNMFAPSALMQSLIEHLEDCDKNLLKDKNCMVVTTSRVSGEKATLDYISKVINYLGGFDSIKIGLNATVAESFEDNAALKEIVEKQTEDYYRLVRQGRKFIIPSEAVSGGALDSELNVFTSGIPKKAKIPAKEAYEKLNLEFTKKQEKDISDITKLFAQKYAQPDTPALGTFSELTPTKTVTPRKKTCKQLTQSLPHYFKSQLANGLAAIVQLSISGGERFDGYFYINNTECEYFEGVAQNPPPDITILADSSVWLDVLKGKHTSQKAFMVGQLKVRGNFALLPKIDQLFKFEVQ